MPKAALASTMFVCGYLEVAGEGYFVISVYAVHYAEVDAYAPVNLVVEPHLVEIGHTQQLTSGLRGIDDGAKQIENCGEGECLAYGSDKLHGLCEELCVQVDDAHLVDAAVQLVDVVGENHAVLLDDIRCSRC